MKTRFLLCALLVTFKPGDKLYLAPDSRVHVW